jgi:hypothetical protein
MTAGGPRQHGPPRTTTAATAWTCFWVSAAVLAFEIAVMRLLLVASWHHFASLVISIVLLGFGASGTVLALLRERVMPRAGVVVEGLALATGSAMVVAIVVMGLVPIEARLAPGLLWSQLGRWLLAWTVLGVPVTLGAATICTALMASGGRVAATYGANLLGSGLGAATAPLLMHAVPVAWLPAACGLAAWLGAAGLVRPSRRRLAAWAVALGATAGAVAIAPPDVRVDPFKYGAALDRLAEQGSVRRVARAAGPRALLEAWSGPVLHDLPFLGVGAAPPPLSVITADGHWAGSVLDVRSAAEAEAMDTTLMAAGYALAAPRPRVALLGEVGGSNAWLALRHGAASVDFIQPNPAVPAMLRGPLADRGGAVVDAAGVRVTVADPRHALEHGVGAYDLVQMVSLEGTAVGSGGLGGLAENHLLTVEGVVAAVRRLDPEGLLMVCRGIQSPPRDNVKIMLTMVEALRRLGRAEPAGHLVVLRDYLAVCTLLKPSPWTAAQIERVRALCAERQLTPVWFPGVRDDELNRPDALDGPPGAAGDWYAELARRAFDVPDTAAVARRYRFDVRPPTDDRPFFHDFCRLASLAALRDAFGELWLTRAELAYPIVLASAVLVTVAGAALTLAPLLVSRRLRRAARAGRPAAAGAYFAALGLGYLLLEIVCLSRLGRLIGDPVTTAALVIATFLLCSGVGSLIAQRRIDLGRSPGAGWIWALAAAAIVVLALARVLPDLAGGLPAPARLAPLALLMGVPMPTGLDRLERTVPATLPWAWAVNGFASVLAAPLATVLGMTWGYGTAAAAGVGCYAVAGLVLPALPVRAPQTGPAG